MTSQRPVVYMIGNQATATERGRSVRKLVLRMLSSVDGFIADSNGDMRFGPHWSEELQKLYARDFTAAGGLIFGRTVYQQYVPYWTAVADHGRHPDGPATDAEVVYARQVRDLPRYVASTTLSTVAGNTTVLFDDPVRQIAELKRQSGDDLLLMCGPALLGALAAQNLVDEYMLDVYPIAIGRGVHLWRDLPQPVDLSLVETRPFPNHVVVNTYALKTAPAHN
jgi:dihydrofolate reductase